MKSPPPLAPHLPSWDWKGSTSASGHIPGETWSQRVTAEQKLVDGKAHRAALLPAQRRLPWVLLAEAAGFT